jgi:hypothetical protein
MNRLAILLLLCGCCGCEASREMHNGLPVDGECEKIDVSGTACVKCRSVYAIAISCDWSK